MPAPGSLPTPERLPSDPLRRAGDRPSERTPGWREVLLVSAAVVVVVLGAAIVTGLLPTELQRIVFHAPLLIGILVLGTVLVLWNVARRRPPVV